MRKPILIFCLIIFFTTIAVAGDDWKSTRQMTIKNPELQLSGITKICNDFALTSIYSVIGAGDGVNIYNDYMYLKNKTKIRKWYFYINSGGGSAFAGLGVSDMLLRYQKNGFKLISYANGIIASATVPIFASCGYRIVAPGTLFMVHEASIFKWMANDSASDIKSQNEMFKKITERYLALLASHSKLSVDQWHKLIKDSTWFTAKKALEWGLANKIE